MQPPQQDAEELATDVGQNSELQKEPRPGAGMIALAFVGLLLGFLRLPWVLLLFCGYASFFKKDAWLARQLNQAFLLYAFYTLVQAAIAGVQAVLRMMELAFVSTEVMWQLYDDVTVGLATALGLAYLLINVVAVIQLVARGDIALPLLQRLLVCFPPVAADVAAPDEGENEMAADAGAAGMRPMEEQHAKAGEDDE